MKLAGKNPPKTLLKTENIASECSLFSKAASDIQNRINNSAYKIIFLYFNILGNLDSTNASFKAWPNKDLKRVFKTCKRFTFIIFQYQINITAIEEVFCFNMFHWKSFAWQRWSPVTQLKRKGPHRPLPTQNIPSFWLPHGQRLLYDNNIQNGGRNVNFSYKSVEKCTYWSNRKCGEY